MAERGCGTATWVGSHFPQGPRPWWTRHLHNIDFTAQRKSQRLSQPSSNSEGGWLLPSSRAVRNPHPGEGKEGFYRQPSQVHEAQSQNCFLPEFFASDSSRAEGRCWWGGAENLPRGQQTAGGGRQGRGRTTRDTARPPPGPWHRSRDRSQIPGRARISL